MLLINATMKDCGKTSSPLNIDILGQLNNTFDQSLCLCMLVLGVCVCGDICNKEGYASSFYIKTVQGMRWNRNGIICID